MLAEDQISFLSGYSPCLWANQSWSKLSLYLASWALKLFFRPCDQSNPWVLDLARALPWHGLSTRNQSSIDAANPKEKNKHLILSNPTRRGLSKVPQTVANKAETTPSRFPALWKLSHGPRVATTRTRLFYRAIRGMTWSNCAVVALVAAGL